MTAAAIGIGAAYPDGPTPIDLLASPSATGPDAFTLGPLTFDPATTLPLCVSPTLCTGGTEGWETFPAPVFPGPPLMTISGGDLDGIVLAPQEFVVYDSSGGAIGSVDTAGTEIDILGQTSYEFTVTSSTAVLGAPASPALPAVGTVYDIFKGLSVGLGGAAVYENVYVATPGSSGTVTDILVLPSGQYSLASPVPLGYGQSLDLRGLLTQNFTGDLSPGNAFSNLVATSGDSSIGPDAFTINVPGFDYRLDPFDTALTPDTYTAVAPLAGFGPLLAAGGAEGFGISAVTQGFNVYNAAGTNVGSFDAAEFVTQLLGLTTTEEVVSSVTPHLGFTTADLPAVGTVFSVTNVTPWNIGLAENIYIATPAGATDTVVSPLGSFTAPAPFNLDSAGNATINPASVFATLAQEQAPQNADIPPPGPLLGGPSTPATDAFTINGLTFYPETSSITEGYNNIAQTMGGAPLLAAFGGTAAGISLGPQDFWYYTGTGASAQNEGALTTSMAVVYLLFFQNAAFTVTGCATLLCTNPPAPGTVFDVLNLGGGIENLYEATPGGTVSDILMTPLGPLIDFIIPEINAAVDFTPADVIPLGFDVPLA